MRGPPTATQAVAVAVLAAALTMLAPPAARAERGQVTLAIVPAASALQQDNAWTGGGGGALDLDVALAEALSLHFNAATTAGPVLAFYTGAGVAYRIDILRLVPILEASVGLLGTSASHQTRYDLGIELGVGFDYLITKRWSIGAIFRYHDSLTHVGEIPGYMYFGPRVGVRFN